MQPFGIGSNNNGNKHGLRPTVTVKALPKPISRCNKFRRLRINITLKLKRLPNSNMVHNSNLLQLNAW